MKLYGAAQAGGSLTALSPGDRMTLFDGTETPAAGLTSVAFCRAPGIMGVPAMIVFTVSFGSSPTAAVVVQGANVNAEAAFQTLNTTTNQQNDWYQDEGNFTFYRVQLSAYTSGGMPTVIAQR